MNIPSAGISDVERIEMQYPFLYFTRAHNPDGSGFGPYRGGLGSYRIYLVYGSKDCSVDYKPYGGVAQGGFGLFGGFPTGMSANRIVVQAGVEMLERVKKGEYPDTQAMRAGEWGPIDLPRGVPERIPLPEGSLVIDYVAGGGGFGDPLDREPRAVARDHLRGWVTRRTAEAIYGVVIEPDGKSIDLPATEARRREIREQRLGDRKPVSAKTSVEDLSDGWRTLLRFHAGVEIAAAGRKRIIRCSRCRHVFCKAGESYKLHALRRVVDLNRLMPYPLPSGDPYSGEFHFYFCPRCAAELQVDLFCPAAGGDPVLWDVQIDTPQ
jgi:hypothetical protein